MGFVYEPICYNYNYIVDSEEGNNLVPSSSDIGRDDPERAIPAVVAVEGSLSGSKILTAMINFLSLEEAITVEHRARENERDQTRFITVSTEDGVLIHISAGNITSDDGKTAYFTSIYATSIDPHRKQSGFVWIGTNTDKKFTGVPWRTNATMDRRVNKSWDISLEVWRRHGGVNMGSPGVFDEDKMTSEEADTFADQLQNAEFDPELTENALQSHQGFGGVKVSGIQMPLELPPAK